MSLLVHHLQIGVSGAHEGLPDVVKAVPDVEGRDARAGAQFKVRDPVDIRDGLAFQGDVVCYYHCVLPAVVRGDISCVSPADGIAEVKT